MTTARRHIATPDDWTSFLAFMGDYPRPCTISVTPGVKRSPNQNKTSHMWYQEAANQLRDEDAESKRAYCKLHIGVPIMRNFCEEYREKYDRLIRPRDYEEKLELMKEPFSFPVTRLMKKEQMWEYQEKVFQHFTALGVQLTEPEK